MEITVRDLVTMLHGMGFGALFMLAFSGAFAELYRMSVSPVAVQPTSRGKLCCVYIRDGCSRMAHSVFGCHIVYPCTGGPSHRSY
jgi:hypothetical protein